MWRLLGFRGQSQVFPPAVLGKWRPEGTLAPPAKAYELQESSLASRWPFTSVRRLHGKPADCSRSSDVPSGRLRVSSETASNKGTTNG